VRPPSKAAHYRRAERNRLPPVTGACPTGKLGYPTKGDARAALKRIRKAHGSTVRRVYDCPLCMFWHLTSQRPPP
jgi:hypothetical protein